MTRRRRWVVLLVLLTVLGGWFWLFAGQASAVRDKAELLLAKAVVGMGIKWSWAEMVIAVDRFDEALKPVDGDASQFMSGPIEPELKRAETSIPQPLRSKSGS